jgi:hypothetical protein
MSRQLSRVSCMGFGFPRLRCETSQSGEEKPYALWIKTGKHSIKGWNLFYEHFPATEGRGLGLPCALENAKLER